ncbi:MAG: GNAT family N-acetyltransferase [bacterium]
MKPADIFFRKTILSDRLWINNFISEHWGAEFVVVRNRKIYPGKLNGFAAFKSTKLVGLVTYKIRKSGCEIVTLNSEVKRKGIGKRLVELVENETRVNNCSSVWLITTNDNLDAVAFYQILGYRLIKVYPGAVDSSRKIKPEIPLVADNGIPIRDELRFFKALSK